MSVLLRRRRHPSKSVKTLEAYKGGALRCSSLFWTIVKAEIVSVVEGCASQLFQDLAIYHLLFTIHYLPI